MTIFLRLAAVEAVYRTDFRGVCFAVLVVLATKNERVGIRDQSGGMILQTDVKLQIN